MGSGKSGRRPRWKPSVRTALGWDLPIAKIAEKEVAESKKNLPILRCERFATQNFGMMKHLSVSRWRLAGVAFLLLLAAACARQPVPPQVQTLLDCYPESILSYSRGRIRFVNGRSLVFDDGKAKDYLQMLDRADIEDMFSMPYRCGSGAPAYLQDPGRIRCTGFFKNAYGRSKKEVRANLVRVEWFDGQQLLFNRRNGAADSLSAVYRALQALPEEFHPYLREAGTFNWRSVRGSDRLSAHSFGIAIDINTQYSDYWQWAFPGAGEQDRIGYRNRIPPEIVAIFEQHGFISGTRWYHFDTMHFEFRPELLAHPSI
ncbi:MAG: M15 family metallopeptidase [Bacteroidales bacterium]|nr:M15 family metallopeptidase [Bacteroidales bacterium]